MAKKIKVAIVAPPFGPTGGPEVMVQHLTEALVKLGADVTLFAPADWKTSAKHVATLPKSLWAMKNFKNQTPEERKALIASSQMKALKHQKDFDILHFHQQRHVGELAGLVKIPYVLTFHSKITPETLDQTKNETAFFTVALSKEHKKNFNISGIIRNGIPIKQIKPSFKEGSHLIAIGRLTESKGIDTAIEIARKTGKKLLILGRVGISKERQKYFNEKIKPFLSKKIIFKNEVPQKEMFEYLREAEAMLFPIKPKKKSLAVCPLIVMESLASGTPVIGVPISSLSSLSKNSHIACLSNNKKALIKAVKNINKFKRKECRKYAEKEFDSSIMAKKYLALYKKILKKSHLRKV
jgi:glycosyltransferase involved in cell wall biosynthesis